VSMSAAHANSYTIEDLGINLDPHAINDDGVMVGSKGNQATEFRDGHWHALKFPDQDGIATAVNARGDAVGFQGNTPVIWSGFNHRRVLALPGGATDGNAHAVAGDGTAAGNYEPVGNFDFPRCFRTLPDGTSTDLGLPPDGEGCFVDGINDAGVIVGGAVIRSVNGVQAFLWRDGTMQNLGTLGGDVSEAFAINDKGYVVGQASIALGGDAHAFLWKRGEMKDIGASPRHSTTRAYAISDRSDIVGEGFLLKNGFPEAVRFAGSVVIPLKDEVQDIGPWTLLSATAVNNDGVIVGRGRLHGDDRLHGFLLRPAP
jgi:probable HAF family extracellular repeat protein